MTVRLIGVDVEDDGARPHRLAMNDISFHRLSRSRNATRIPIRLLIVPAQNVFDGVIAVALELQSSEVYVGESETLSAGDQARPSWRGMGARRARPSIKSFASSSITTAAGLTLSTLAHILPLYPQ